MSPRRAAALRAGGSQNLREHLVTAAERLIARHGTAGLTVRDIAREAGVADGVLYNHFADKEELLAYALQAHVGAVERTLGEPPGRPGSGTVAANLRRYLARGLAFHLAVVPVFASLLTQRAVLDRFAELTLQVAGRGLRNDIGEYLRAEQALGRVAPDANVDAAATMIVGACHEMVLPPLFHGGPAADIPPTFVEDVVATVLAGIDVEGRPGADRH